MQGQQEPQSAPRQPERAAAEKLLRCRASKSHSQPPVSLRGQLLWREFFYTVGAATPNFQRMQGNALCKQLFWKEREEHLAAWREARTGFPWIDAIMTQLREWVRACPASHTTLHCYLCWLLSPAARPAVAHRRRQDQR